MSEAIAKVIAKVISQEGTCVAGHKINDEFVIGEQTPPNLCIWAFCSLLPYATVLQFGGSFPWAEDPDTTTVACSDPLNPVVFELRRVQPQ